MVVQKSRQLKVLHRQLHFMEIGHEFKGKHPQRFAFASKDQFGGDNHFASNLMKTSNMIFIKTHSRCLGRSPFCKLCQETKIKI